MPKHLRNLVRLAAAAALALPVPALARAAEQPEVSVTLAPVRYAFVEGDVQRFQAQHWMPEHYTGGLEDLSGHYVLPDGTELSLKSHALEDANDLGTAIELRKAALGFATLNYEEFRKYYDNSGGYYRRFTRLFQTDLPEDLSLDIGKLELETGLTLEGLPTLTFGYEREFKNGTKSRLTWAPAKEGGTTRKIAPSWQQIHEIVDNFALKSEYELAGFALEGEQRWEFVRSEAVREEASVATTATASDYKIRRQFTEPEATLATTTLGSHRWFGEDKAFFSSAYRFNHMDAREFENFREYGITGGIFNFSRPEQKVNARADNDYDSHTWTENFLVHPVGWLRLDTKLKAEMVRQEGTSRYPADSLPGAAAQVGEPDNLINRFDVSNTGNKANRWGESVGLQVTAIPRTALYTELELEQGRILMREARNSVDGPDAGNGVDTAENLYRETVTKVRRGSWTLGGRATPWRMLSLTANVRHRRNNNDYDDQFETAAAGGARSAFVDSQYIHTNEFEGRVVFTPCRAFRGGFRYQHRGDRYITRAEAEDTVKTDSTSHTFTYDVTAQPMDTLMATVSYSRLYALTKTPARLSRSSAYTPAYRGDVGTWLFSVEYAPLKPSVVLTGSLALTGSSNFNDFSSNGIPLGAEFRKMDLTTGAEWHIDELTSLGAEYAYYRYATDANADLGNYRAHVLSLNVTRKF